ncbi:MAG: bifunctional oligoribonuclease/PAP phosphatase NrnA [Lachnospiraceae bacterium]|jgi:phosphoesterase RecJ-like protein|nr:bifunctional oligoribonuclease/PAP phosphatase NrnA [Lachnospiraceae bacterium]
MTLDNIKEEIMSAKNIAILTHESPDGDAVGSALAMYNALKQLGKDVDLIMPEYPSIFAFLPSAKEIKETGKEDSYDLAIAVDCSDLKRIAGDTNFENANTTISIDHHGVNTMFADYNFVNPAIPACAQILITVLEYIGVQITKDIGTCIVAGIITDTGGFKYQGVTSETFEFVARLLNEGVNVSDVYKRVFQTITKTSFELKKLAMNRMEFLENGKITYTYITEEDKNNIGSQNGDHEGIVELGRDVEGVEVSIFIRQEKDGYKVSLRSNNYVNVSDIALLFGGGGHPRASGFTMNLPLDEAKERIISKVKMYL